MSFFVYLDELPSLTDESNMSLIIDEIFGVNLFQQQNFEQLMSK